MAISLDSILELLPVTYTYADHRSRKNAEKPHFSGETFLIEFFADRIMRVFAYLKWITEKAIHGEEKMKKTATKKCEKIERRFFCILLLT